MLEGIPVTTMKVKNTPRPQRLDGHEQQRDKRRAATNEKGRQQWRVVSGQYGESRAQSLALFC